jgi:WD40 repeat protein
MNSVAWSPDGTGLVTGTSGFSTILWDVQTGEPLGAMPGGFIRQVAWSPDGSLLAAISTDGLRLWDASTGSLINHSASFSGCGVDWSPDGTHLAIARGGMPVIVSVQDAQVAAGEYSQDGLCSWAEGLRAVDWSPEGQRVVSGSQGEYADGFIALWDAASLNRLWSYELESPLFIANDVAFSPDGSLVTAAISGDFWGQGQVLVLSAQTGEIVMRLGLRDTGATSVAWSPDGSLLAAGYGIPRGEIFRLGFELTNDGPVMLWNARTGEELAAFTAHNSGVQSIAFSPDGSRLASASLDGTVLIWAVP